MNDVNHYFCMLKPARKNMHGNLTEAEGQIFADHCAYLSEKFAAKAVLQAGTSFETGEEGFAIVIVAAQNKEAAIALIQADPAVARGLLTAKVTEYDIFLDRGLAST